jgi:hypothetical protein
VLEHGLPAPPEVLTYQMSIPIAYWKEERCAVVLFLPFHRWEQGRWDPMALMAMYSRDEDQWTTHRHWMSTSFSPDPITRPGDLWLSAPWMRAAPSWLASRNPSHPSDRPWRLQDRAL